METGYSDRGGWFINRPNSTGDSSCWSSIPKYVLAASLLVAAGTGALADDLTRLQQQRPNDSTISNSVKINVFETTYIRTPAEDMARIRDSLSPAMSDLAKSFNVSRQTIYNWLNGENPTSEHIVKLKDFALAADTFAAAGINMSGILLKRKITNGRNLFEYVQSGGAAVDAAQLLTQIIKQEREQKERITARYAGRTTSQSFADSDLMAANDV